MDLIRRKTKPYTEPAGEEIESFSSSLLFLLRFSSAEIFLFFPPCQEEVNDIHSVRIKKEKKNQEEEEEEEEEEEYLRSTSFKLSSSFTLNKALSFCHALTTMYALLKGEREREQVSSVTSIAHLL